MFQNIMDASVPLNESDEVILEIIKDKKNIVLLNKSDLNTVVTTETVEDVVKNQVSTSVEEQVKEQVSVADDSDIDSLFS